MEIQTSATLNKRNVTTHTEAGGTAPGAKALADVANRAAAARKSLAMVVQYKVQGGRIGRGKPREE
jgi:hypothetical protein